jgi:predicted nucleotidyltransferase
MRTLENLSEAERSLAADLLKRLVAALPGVGVHMTIFGSRARGDAEPDSDMDVLVELDTEHVSFADKQRLRWVATEVSIASGIIVSLLVVDQSIMAERGDFSIFENVREEGIAV